jgi:trehalose/maltose hydrolase-like predicted phosphorylase
VSDTDTALTPTTALEAISAKSVDPWFLVRRGRESANSAQDESLFALANGTLGVRGGVEEAGSPTQGCFLSGAWERTQIEYHERFSGFA